MLKRLIRILIIILGMYWGAKAYLVYGVHNALETLKADYQDSISLSYAWIDVNFQGDVVLEGVSVTLFSLKRSLKADSLRLSFGDYLSAIQNIESLLKAPMNFPFNARVEGLEWSLEGRDFTQWLGDKYGDQWLSPLGLNECGAYEAVDFAFLRSIGLERLDMDLELDVYTSPETASDISFTWAIDQLGSFKVEADWKPAKTLAFNDLLNMEFLSKLDHFERLDLVYQDASFVRKLRKICDPDDVGLFADMSSVAWALSLQKQGILISENLMHTYRDYINEGGVIALAMEDLGLLKVDNIDELMDKNLAELVGFTAAINHHDRSPFKIVLDKKYFSPEPVKMDKGAGEIKRYEQKFRSTEFSELLLFIGKKIRVTMKDGQSYEGILTETDEFKAEVLVNLPGGSVTYNVKPHASSLIEVWR